jgi:hypothetical protein
MSEPRKIMVVIEYSEKEKRVMVRRATIVGLREIDETPLLPKLDPANWQNYVQVFERLDMGKNVGFLGLVPDPEQPSPEETQQAIREAKHKHSPNRKKT